MSIWQFNRGNWESIPDPIDHEKGEGDLENTMTAAGWEQYNLVTSEKSGNIGVWKKDDAFYIWIRTVHDGDAVLCPDFPSYLMFLKEFALPFMTLEEMSSKVYATWDAEERREKMHVRTTQRSFDRTELSYLKK